MVNYAGLKDHPQHDLAQKYVKGKPSAILSFGVQDGLEGGTRFIDALQLFTRLGILGMLKVWPATQQPPPTASSMQRNLNRQGQYDPCSFVHWYRAY